MTDSNDQVIARLTFSEQGDAIPQEKIETQEKKPLPTLWGGQATVVTWDVPENMKLSKGCLDVLAAGH